MRTYDVGEACERPVTERLGQDQLKDHNHLPSKNLGKWGPIGLYLTLEGP